MSILTPRIDAIEAESLLTTYLKDVKASGTSGGTATPGTYQTRILNTQEGNISFCSLSSNQFTLLAGTYIIEAVSSYYQITTYKSKIRNITNSTDEIISLTGSRGTTSVGGFSHLFGNITITSPKVFELQYRAGSTAGTSDLGLAASYGDNEVYSIVKITKVG
jgi:hypothetical protein